MRTPPKFVKQFDLADALSKQIETKTKEQITRKQEDDYMERMEQIKLAEEYFLYRNPFLQQLNIFLFQNFSLASQREAYLRDRLRRQAELKNALDQQVIHIFNFKKKVFKFLLLRSLASHSKYRNCSLMVKYSA